MDAVFLGIALISYIISMFFYFAYSFLKRDWLAASGRFILIAGVLLHLSAVAIRLTVWWGVSANRWFLPLAYFYDTFSFFGLVILIEFLIIQYRRDLDILGGLVTPLAVAMCAAALHFHKDASLSLPIKLQSPLLAAHVPLIFISYGAFTNAFAIGLAFLIQERQLKSRRPSHLAFRLPPLDELDALIYRVILFGVPVLLLGLFHGVHWARSAWQGEWQWDLKITLAFLTLIIYFIYIFMRAVVGWRGRKAAYLSLVGFALVFITYLGVNHASKLHSFLSSGKP
jgi:cytochrome c-type biogenesis protein CcsB